MFSIPIGDWSGDGHKEVEYFDASAAKSLEDVREAFFAGQKKFPKLDPCSFVSEYEDYEVPKDVIEAAGKKGFLIDPKNFHTQEMADFVVWFLNLADPELDVKIEKNHDMLAFYGRDKKKRHIKFIGYGLLGG